MPPPPRQKWSYWPLLSPRRPRCPSSHYTSDSSAVSSTNPSFIGSETSENGEIVEDVAQSASLRFAAPTFRFAWWRRHKSQEYSGTHGKEDPGFHLGHLKRFYLQELQAATNNFSYKNMVGEDAFGNVYKGRLADGSLVSVKRLTGLTSGEDLQFQSEVELVSMAVHPNLLRIRGFCMTSNEKLLVYPFMANGSVESHLRGRTPSKSPLDWPTRRRIALGSARALSYLHEHCDPIIIHRDVKAAHIYLDEEFDAVVGDFGIARIMESNVTHVTTAIRGTAGYIAPEYLCTGKCTQKTDVFSYGMMLMELITGKRIYELARLADDDDIMLLYWLKDSLREKRHEMLVDSRLEGNYEGTEVESLFQISQLCIQGSAEDRPKMSEVVRMFDGDGLTERWEEWMKVEVARRELDVTSDHVEWSDSSDDPTYDLDTLELSGPN